MRNRFPLFKGRVSPLGHSDRIFFLLKNGTQFQKSVSNRALRFHFGSSNITERSIPVVLTAFVRGCLNSIHSASNSNVRVRHAYLNSLPPKQESRASWKAGRDRAFTWDFACKFFPFLMFVFSEVYLSSSVGLKKRWPKRFLLVGLVMFFQHRQSWHKIDGRHFGSRLFTGFRSFSISHPFLFTHPFWDFVQKLHGFGPISEKNHGGTPTRVSGLRTRSTRIIVI